MEKHLSRFINGLILPYRTRSDLILPQLKKLHELAKQACDEAKFGRVLNSFPLSPGSLFHRGLQDQTLSDSKSSAHCSLIWVVPATRDLVVLNSRFDTYKA